MRPLPWLRAHAGRAALAGGAAALLLAAWALLAPARAPLAGWLVGLVFWIGIALGALGLLAMRALTGGKWAGSLRPALGPAAASLPFFLLACLPLLFGLRTLYPWASDPGLLPVEDIPRLYLNADSFAARTLLALVGWSALGWWLLRRPGAVAGGLGLAFHLGALTLISVDWMLSLEPRFFSTAFGLATFLLQLLAALAWAATLRPEQEGDDPGRAGDLAGLLFATALGSLYLGFAQFLVSWYGNLPEKAAWFLKREEGIWIWLQALALALAAALPLGAILLGRVRRSPAALARLGPPVLVGVAAHQAWIVAPAVGPWALPAAALGLVAVGGLWVGLAYGPLAARLEAKHGRA
ncbi:hypothetical protein [Roseomonas indoligenes]|uniref:Quinol:cytochrome c oxidoreductase quinone-binding subunit 2 n=1 Tax=Roseomonas indoligenes TaxID=2820811 RepID=A0A940S2R2_9PROT|nr:hypothetical protein [Pararoseomonas indoligenes]MBP0491411.1 hypothetical protein [Pararoseomonas indoligenes]